MRHITCLTALTLVTLAGCSGSGAPTTPGASQTTPVLDGADPVAALQDGGGMTTGVLGVYRLTQDPADASLSRLEPWVERAAEASDQGDIYHLSIRPFLLPESLLLTGTTPGPNGTFDHSFTFTHPYGLPADFNPPSTGTKRMDLFIFDVNVVALANGTDYFFGPQVTTNYNLMPNADGFRQIGPMVNLGALGVTSGNVFPYKLLANLNPVEPAGNYDNVDGWDYWEVADANGYDVIPQGGSAQTLMRLDRQSSTIPLVVMAKYTDPRQGATLPEKRASRLPNATDSSVLRYYVPEASGDLQHIRMATAGQVTDVPSATAATITATVLDWDNASPVASVWPDPANLTHISAASGPKEAHLSAPAINSSGTYALASVSEPYGEVNEFLDLTFSVNNVNGTVSVPPEGGTVKGLIRVRDAQDDGTANVLRILDESLNEHTWQGVFEPSTRFQRIDIPVSSSAAPPDITEVTPLAGIDGTQVTFIATNAGGAVTSYAWGFGGGANPDTSTAATPLVTLSGAGTYTGLLRASNAGGSEDFYFEYEVTSASPVITDVSWDSDLALRDATFTSTNTGEPATEWLWDFDGGATPDTSTEETPTVKLGVPGTYNGTLTASNAGGSFEFPFTFTTVPKEIGIRVSVVKSGASFPRLWGGLPAWNQTAVANWFVQYINPIFRNSGIAFDPDQVTLVEVNNSAIYNIDTQADYDALWNGVLTGPTGVLNLWAINDFNGGPVAGAMTDCQCNYTNSCRGCWVIAETYNPSMVVYVAHELGHVMNLPHIRTSGPLTSKNYNLMSYGTLSTALENDIAREDPSGCGIWPGNPMDQHQVVNNWNTTYLP